MKENQSVLNQEKLRFWGIAVLIAAILLVLMVIGYIRVNIGLLRSKADNGCNFKTVCDDYGRCYRKIDCEWDAGPIFT